jgi:hypothetical protein
MTMALKKPQQKDKTERPKRQHIQTTQILLFEGRQRPSAPDSGSLVLPPRGGAGNVCSASTYGQNIYSPLLLMGILSK